MFEIRTYSNIARHGFCVIYGSLEEKVWPTWDQKTSRKIYKILKSF